MTVIMPGTMGFDTNRNTINAVPGLWDYGYRFASRYVCQENTLTNRKIIRAVEYAELVAKGFVVFFNSEWYTPHDSPSGTPSPFRYGRDLASLYRAADEDVAVAVRLMNACDPAGEQPCLYSVDWDSTGLTRVANPDRTNPSDMALYLQRCRDKQRELAPKRRFGIYCGGNMLRFLIDRGYFGADDVIWWQASAWSVRFPEPECHFLQTDQVTIDGVLVDNNIVYRPINTRVTTSAPGDVVHPAPRPTPTPVDPASPDNPNQDYDMPATRYLHSNGTQYILGPNGNDVIRVTPEYAELLNADGGRLIGPNAAQDSWLDPMAKDGGVRDTAGVVVDQLVQTIQQGNATVLGRVDAMRGVIDTTNAAARGIGDVFDRTGIIAGDVRGLKTLVQDVQANVLDAIHENASNGGTGQPVEQVFVIRAVKEG